MLAADACTLEGLDVAELSAETKKRLSKLVPAVGTSVDNPVDLGMATVTDASIYAPAIEALAADDNVDAILVIGSGDPTFGQVVVNVRGRVSQPLVVASLASPESSPEAYLFLAANGVAAYPDTRRAVAALGKLHRYQQWVG